MTIKLHRTPPAPKPEDPLERIEIVSADEYNEYDKITILAAPYAKEKIRFITNLRNKNYIDINKPDIKELIKALQELIGE